MSVKRTKSNQRINLRPLVLMALFAAIAFSSIFLFRFNVQFLTFDLKDAVITLAGLLLGPVAALIVSLLVATLEFIAIPDTGPYGFLMNFASSAAFSVACALVYPYRKKLSGAILSLGAGLLTMVTLMMLLNLVVTPLYMGVPVKEVAVKIPTLFLPFNALKGAVNAALVLILYKPVHRALQATRLMPRTSSPKEISPQNRQKQIWINVIISVAGVLLLGGAIAVLYFVMGGRFEFFWNK